jgi:hypothetical protein
LTRKARDYGRVGLIEKDTAWASSESRASFAEIAVIDEWWQWTQGLFVGTLMATGTVRAAR